MDLYYVLCLWDSLVDIIDFIEDRAYKYCKETLPNSKTSIPSSIGINLTNVCLSRKPIFFLLYAKQSQNF